MSGRGDSRYRDCIPFVVPPGEKPSYAGIRPRAVETPPGVVEHLLTDWDRPDLLALHYYNDTRLWWRILDANPGLGCAADLVPDAERAAAPSANSSGSGGSGGTLEPELRVLLVPRAP